MAIKITPMAVKKVDDDDCHWYIGEGRVDECEAIKWNDEYAQKEAKILSCLSHVINRALYCISIT